MKILEVKIRNDIYIVEGTLNGASSLEDFENVEISSITKNGKVEETFGETWLGKKTDCYKFFNALLAAYVNDDITKEFLYVCREIEEFRKSIQTYSFDVYGRAVPNIVITPGLYKCGLVAVIRDEHKEIGFAYYISEDGEKYVLTRLDGSVVTDIEDFFVEGLIEDVQNKDIVYIDSNTKRWLKEAFDVEVKLR